MKYKKDVPQKDITKALGLEKAQELRLNNAIQKSYNQSWDAKGPNVDQIYSDVAPYIKTQEEAFYVANVVLTDIFGAMQELGQGFFRPDIN